MKKNFKKTLLLVAISPFLMATTTLPEPGVTPEYYSDFTLNYLKEEDKGDQHCYYFHLDNTGNGYIERIFLYASSENNYFTVILDSSDISSPFLNATYQPGASQDIVFVTSTPYEKEFDFWHDATAYTSKANEIRVSGSKNVSLIQKNYSDFVYQIDLFLSNRNDDAFYYGAIVEVAYQDKISFIKVDKENEYKFETSQSLDLDSLSIKSVTPIKSKKPSSFSFWDCSSVFSGLLEVFIILSVISFGIFAAIFFPAMARRRRRRAMQQNNS